MRERAKDACSANTRMTGRSRAAFQRKSRMKSKSTSKSKIQWSARAPLLLLFLVLFILFLIVITEEEFTSICDSLS
jgi:hypothetical protein